MENKQTIQEQLSCPEVMVMVNQWLGKNKGSGRRALARYLCAELELKDPRGELRLAGVQKALRVLESRGYWRLPEAPPGGTQGWKARRLEAGVAAPQGVPSRVEAVAGLHLVEVSRGEDALFRTWNELMLSEHPLHDCRLVGRQLRYLIGSDHGWLGGLGFASCALRLRVRDQWLGWDDSTRKSFQARLINLTRFLIRPQVVCENLASRVLSLGLSRVGEDFHRRYALEPWLVESFVDREHYAGVCYRAANWHYVGATQGRGRTAPNRQVTSCKDVYVYELRRDWRRRMGVGPAQEPIQVVHCRDSVHNEHWVDDEFGEVDFGHAVSEQRLRHIVRRKAQNPAASYAQCCAGNRHELKAYYRFMGNRREQICEEGILAAHCRRTVGRMKGSRRVLAIQDSTDLDFSERLHCNGLGVIGTNQTGAISAGLKMHSVLALSEEGLPLGVLKTHLYAPELGGNKAAHRPIEEKQSYRWLKTLEQLGPIAQGLGRTELICVGDRESDIFELFDYRRRRFRKVHLLVRAQYNRCLEGESAKLFDQLGALPVMGRAQIEIPRQREKKGKPSRPGRAALAARQAHVQLKWNQVTLAAPDKPQTKNLLGVQVYAVEMFEPDPPAGAQQVHWVLLTTIPIHSAKQALRCLRWYALRWRIEEWHRVLKSGCQIESHQHQTQERLARAIAIDAVIAWRVMLLTFLGREVPEIPCELIFSPWECALLETLQPELAPETMRGPKRGLCASVPPAPS